MFSFSRKINKFFSTIFSSQLFFLFSVQKEMWIVRLIQSFCAVCNIWSSFVVINKQSQSAQMALPVKIAIKIHARNNKNTNLRWNVFRFGFGLISKSKNVDLSVWPQCLNRTANASASAGASFIDELTTDWQVNDVVRSSTLVRELWICSSLCWTSR